MFHRFMEEKKRLEDQIREQNKLLSDEKQRAELISHMHEQELEDKLKKEEEVCIFHLVAGKFFFLNT